MYHLDGMNRLRCLAMTAGGITMAVSNHAPLPPVRSSVRPSVLLSVLAKRNVGKIVSEMSYSV